jgi:hypothetical protein
MSRRIQPRIHVCCKGFVFDSASSIGFAFVVDKMVNILTVTKEFHFFEEPVIKVKGTRITASGPCLTCMGKCTGKVGAGK